MMSNSPLQPPLPVDVENQCYGNLQGCSLSLAASRLANLHAHHHKTLTVFLCPNMVKAKQLKCALSLFTSGYTIPLMLLPDWETLPYDQFSPHPSIISQRLKLLHRLPRLTSGILIVPMTTCLQRLPPRAYIESRSFVLACGEELDVTALRTRMLHYGYRIVAQVMAPGELSIRGSVLDVFPTGSKTPLRIDLFGNEVDSIRAFDIETQRSISGSNPRSSVEILPAR